MLSELQAIPALLHAEFSEVQVVSTESLPSVPTGCCYGIALPAGVSPLGDRPTIGLDVPAITEAALRGREAACCRAVLVHELGHLAVEPPREWSSADTAFIGADMLPLRARLLTRSFAGLKPTSGPCPHHGARFIRAAMHVYGRSQQLGLDVPLEIVVGVGLGWLSPEQDYFRVLHGEIHGMRRVVRDDPGDAGARGVFGAVGDRRRPLPPATSRLRGIHRGATCKMFGLTKTPAADPHPFAKERATVKATIAELQLEHERLREIQRAISRVDGEVDAAEERHEAATRPIQDELATIRSETVDATVAGRELSPEREARRMELQDQLDAENEKLREAVRRADDKRNALQHEALTVTAKLKTVDGHNAQTLQSKLAGELARLEQRLQTYVADRAATWAGARVEAAERAHRDVAKLVAEKERNNDLYQLAELKNRLSRFEAELNAAREARAIALAYQRELHEQIIAE